MNKPVELDSALLLDVLDSFNLNSRVNFPTHKLGNTLDLIMHDTGLNIIMSTSQGRLFQITIQSCMTSPSVVLYTRTSNKPTRKSKHIVAADFSKDLFKTMLDDPLDGIFNDKVSYCNTKLRGILDKHAPINIEKCSSRKKVPWFNEDIA